jgi:hypothetical protein
MDLNLILWMLQILLAVAFVGAGIGGLLALFVAYGRFVLEPIT